jgi:hypothetical protein
MQANEQLQKSIGKPVPVRIPMCVLYGIEWSAKSFSIPFDPYSF